MSLSWLELKLRSHAATVTGIAKDTILLNCNFESTEVIQEPLQI